MPWPAGSPNSRLSLGHAAGEDEQPVRPTHAPRPATSAASSPIALRSSAAGGSRGPDEDRVRPAIEEQPGHLQRIGRLGARRDRPPAAPCRGRHERGERPFRGRDDPERPGRIGADLEADEVRRRRRRSGRGAPRSPGRPGSSAVEQDRERGIRAVDARQGDRADQPPGTTELADDGDGDGGGADVDGREGARLAGHRRMLPGRTARRAEAQCRSVRRPRSSRRRSPRAA